MASIVLLPSGKYRAQVCVLGTRDTKVFDKKREAQLWGVAREVELRTLAKKHPSEKFTLGDALARYLAEVTPTKRGAVWESVRIKAMSRMLPASSMIGEITPQVVANYRDARLKEVTPASVLRDLGVLSAVLETARVEWRWLSSNPVRDIRKPRKPAHRAVLITPRQIYQMLKAMGYSPVKPVRSITHAVAMTFLFALRTGMRSKEICTLTWANVFADHVHLPVTKTVARDVPLTPKMKRLLERMRGFDSVLVFGVGAASRDALFRKYRKRAGLAGFTFHDARHTAATWLVKYSRLNAFELCKIFGWQKTDQALTYFNPTPRDLAAKM